MSESGAPRLTQSFAGPEKSAKGAGRGLYPTASAPLPISRESCHRETRLDLGAGGRVSALPRSAPSTHHLPLHFPQKPTPNSVGGIVQGAMPPLTCSHTATLPSPQSPQPYAFGGLGLADQRSGSQGRPGRSRASDLPPPFARRPPLALPSTRASRPAQQPLDGRGATHAVGGDGGRDTIALRPSPMNPTVLPVRIPATVPAPAASGLPVRAALERTDAAPLGGSAG